ncbi:MAG: hypothetical protein PHC84_00975 [Clostridia bacterium]|nr:hypothetical protein [Clostridia bacterium]
MRRLLKILIIIVLVALNISLFAGHKLYEKKKAMIMLPGFLGSMLIDEENIYWVTYPLEGQSYEAPKESKKGVLTRLISTLIMDEEGRRKIDMYPPSPFDETMSGGTYNQYLDIYKHLKARFSEQYEVLNFQYDWMKSSYDNAKKLDAFIEENGYDEVVLLAHSMGGIVGDNYLSLGEKQRSKISLYATFGSPHAGVVETLHVLEARAYGGLPAVFSELFGDLVFDIVRNMPAALQMLPSKLLLDSPYYKNAEGGHTSFIRIQIAEDEYRYLTDWEEIKDFYASREWSQYITDTEKSGQPKRTFNEALEMFNRLYYQDGGSYKHVTELVNSYFFVGEKERLSAKVCVQYNLNGTVRSLYAKNYTDNTVSIPSAACGLPLDDERVIYFPEVDHGGIFMMIDEERHTPIDKLEELLNALSDE